MDIEELPEPLRIILQSELSGSYFGAFYPEDILDGEYTPESLKKSVFIVGPGDELGQFKFKFKRNDSRMYTMEEEEPTDYGSKMVTLAGEGEIHYFSLFEQYGMMEVLRDNLGMKFDRFPIQELPDSYRESM